jgi:copper chaperone CopZ
MVFTTTTRSRRGVRLGLAIALAGGFATGCASTPTDSSAAPGQISDSTIVEAGEDTLVLLAYGMACPKCVTNADLQLLKLPGVASVRIDMKHGLIFVTLDGSARPTRGQLTKAITDAGLTLVQIHGRIGEES